MYYCHCSVGTCLSNKFILKLLKTLKVNFIESLQKLEFHGVMRFYYQNPDPGSGQKVWNMNYQDQIFRFPSSTNKVKV